MTAKKKILCIDDELDILDVAKLALEADGQYEVTSCNKPKEALRMAKMLRPNAILLDMMMPEMDGVQVIKALQLDPETRNIPVLFMTAKMKSQDIDIYMAMGAVGVIAKPFDHEELPFQVGLVA